MSNFKYDILSRIESFFSEQEIETLIKVDETKSVFEQSNSAVKIIHKPTKTEIVCEEYDSQIENKATAILKLMQILRES